MDRVDAHVSEQEGRMVNELFLGRRGRFRAYIFELATAVVYMLVGVTNIISPQAAVHTSVGRTVPPFDTVWSLLYMLGAACVVTGILKPFPALRVAGLTLLGTGLLMQTAAALTFAVQPRAFSPFVYAAACFARAYMVSRLIIRTNSRGRIAHAAIVRDNEAADDHG